MNFKLKHWHLNATSFSEALGIFTHVLMYGYLSTSTILPPGNTQTGTNVLRVSIMKQ